MRAAPLALVLAALGGGAVADEAPCARNVSVVGHASSAQAPDFAEIAVGIEAKGPNAATALDAASKAVAGISALAREAGIPPADIGTAAVSLQPVTRPVTRPGGGTREEPDGYMATNVVRLRVGDMGRLGDLLRRTLDSGANRIDGITFGLRDPEAARAALQVAAAKDARTRAVALAEAVGAKLGSLCTLSALDGAPPPYPMRAMASRAVKAAPVPVEAGTIESTASVTATFALAP
ncbi:SIMPL domain-containing protein [Methylobacterium komagatae]